eukprot:gene13827-16340_t
MSEPDESKVEPWEQIFPASSRASAKLKVDYPTSGWEKWQPVVFEQFRLVVLLFFFLLAIEGCIMEGISIATSPSEVKESWFMATLMGERKAFDNDACFPTMFDELFSNAVQSLLGVLSYFIAVASGSATVAAYIYDDRVSFQSETANYGLESVEFNPLGVLWDRPMEWRRALGPTNAPDTALWIGARTVSHVEETGHVEDVLAAMFNPSSVTVDPEVSNVDTY